MRHAGSRFDAHIERQRREFRAFALLHHPDRGGDPETFRAGVAAHRDRIRIRDDDPRLAAPIVITRRRRGPIGLVDAAARAWERSHRPPRVR